MQRPAGALSPAQPWLLALLLAGLGWALAVPVWDSDFWWHLASGRWIWQAGALPTSDPFGVFGAANPVRSETVLRGQWLGQLLLYGLYQLGGTTAIVALRVGLLLASLLLAYDRMRRSAVPPLLALAMLALAGLCLQAYTGERPQLLSIFLASLCFWLADAARTRPRLCLALPPLGLLWANIHGGVVLGSLLIALLAAGMWWQSRRGAPAERHAARWLLAAAALFGAATLLTPNGLAAYAYILDLQGSELQARTTEYVSAFKLWQLGQWQLQAWVGAVLLLAVAGAAGLLRRDPGKALLVLLLAALSVESFRYLVFLLVVGMPYAAAGLARLLAVLPPLAARLRLAAACGLVLATLLVLLAQHAGRPRGGIDAQRYPVALAPAAGTLAGPGFNYMNWGGYLLWHAPALVPYIDGRMLEDARLIPYTHMLWVSPQGRLWFEQAGFGWVLIPYFDQHGEVYALNHYLVSHPQWQLQAQSGNERLYVRRDNAQRGWQTGQ